MKHNEILAELNPETCRICNHHQPPLSKHSSDIAMRLLYLSKEIWTTDYGVEEGQVKLVAVWIPNPEMYLNFSIEYVSNLAPPPNCLQ